MINVYWACLEKEGLRAKDPSSILKEISKEKMSLGYPRCPAFIEHLDNVYGVPSIYNYKIKVDREKGEVYSEDYDQAFFSEHVLTEKRDMSIGFLSYIHRYVFFTDEPSLKITITPSYLDDNSFNKNAILVPGTMDIGKYFRGTECAFQLRDGVDEVEFKEDENYMYIHFDTKEEINFKKFTYNPAISELGQRVLNSKEHRSGKHEKLFRPLKHWYRLFKSENLKKQILTEIRKQF
jgi:hypothetical protein